MNAVSPEDFKALALDILIDFNNVCKKNNLDYTLAYGTLLGAIRHKGYIPWDDDIDVIMLREDYEKFVLIANSQLKENHKFISIETEKKFMAPLAKIIDLNTELKQTRHVAERITLGVYIDIFVYDEIPEDLKQRKKLYKKSAFLQNAWGFCENRPSKKNCFLVALLRRVCNRTTIARFFSKKLKENALTYKGNYVASLMFGEHLNRSIYELPIEYINDLVDIEFEGYFFKAIRNYDFCLSRWYGDYMKLPPKEKQVCRHDYTVYYKEKV